MSKPRIYLCSRVNPEAHERNNAVIAELNDFAVFIPQYCSRKRTYDEIFLQDHVALEKSDVMVVVPHIGLDCAYEIGWATARGIPVIIAACWDGLPKTWEHSPMMRGRNIRIVYQTYEIPNEVRSAMQLDPPNTDEAYTNGF